MRQHWIQDHQTKICIYSSVKYSPEIRNLVLQAKIKGSDTAIAIIKQMFLKSLLETDILNYNYDLVVPCPSSPWSRIMGRTDLAFELAKTISIQSRLNLKLPPFFSYWNFRKRSFHKNRFLPIKSPKSYLKRLSTLHSLKNQNILLIDDVSTTGWTMLRTSKFFCSSNHFQGIVFSGK